MSYTHFGKQADVWKHLVLCELLNSEQPNLYIETNSAFAEYALSHTPEQEYGIYHFLKKGKDISKLTNSIYWKIEAALSNENKYLGSPALAITILGNRSSKYYFFDLDPEALADIEKFASRNDLSEKVLTINKDSIQGTLDLLPDLSPNAFLHIDPYEIDKADEKGKTYLDVFLESAKLGLPVLLWFGFQTLDDKNRLTAYIKSSLKKNNIERYTCVNLIMDIIEKDTLSCNPGVLGSGLLATNVTEESHQAILDYSEILVELYKGSQYLNCKGGIYREILL